MILAFVLGMLSHVAWRNRRQIRSYCRAFFGPWWPVPVGAYVLLCIVSAYVAL